MALYRRLRREAIDIDVHPLDLTQSGAAEELTAPAGNVDILVNNASVIPSRTVFDVDEADGS